MLFINDVTDSVCNTANEAPPRVAGERKNNPNSADAKANVDSAVSYRICNLAESFIKAEVIVMWRCWGH